MTPIETPSDDYTSPAKIPLKTRQDKARDGPCHVRGRPCHVRDGLVITGTGLAITGTGLAITGEALAITGTRPVQVQAWPSMGTGMA